MKHKLLSALFFSILLFSCSDSSKLTPFKIEYKSEFHCWPYQIKVYEIKDFLFNPSLKEYPLNDLLKNNNSYVLKWTPLSEFNELNFTYINNCDESEGKTNIINQSEGVYISGFYTKSKDRLNNPINNYYIKAVIDSNQNLLYFFENINYHR